jgi:small subunit ribosomal protein S6
LRRYETVFIAVADLPDEEVNGLIERSVSIVNGLKGLVVKIDRWGKKRLAYEIKKQTRGYYILIDYAGNSAIVNELERNFKIDDKVLKYMTIIKSEHADIQALEKEIAAKTEKIEEPQSPEPPKTPEAAAEKE